MGRRMALEAVSFPYDCFGYCGKECCAMVGGRWVDGIIGGREEVEKGVVAAEGDRVVGVGCGTSSGGAERGREASDSAPHGEWGPFCSSVLKSLEEEWDVDSSSPETCIKEGTTPAAEHCSPPAATAAVESRAKRRRTKCCKNREEVENQRMNHIAVERNRRKQMNEYLSVLRSLMPPSYVERGDQASTVSGAINFVKELEQLLQSLEAQKRVKERQRQPDAASSPPFSRFFTFPQYSSSTSPPSAAARASSASPSHTHTASGGAGAAASDLQAAEKNARPAVADIEVTMVESHANLRVLSRRKPNQLLRLVAGLQALRLSVLHLNVTSAADQMVLYSFSLKVEEDCHLSSVDDIAGLVHQMLAKIQDQAGF